MIKVLQHAKVAIQPSRYCIRVGGFTADLYGTLGFNHQSVKAIAWQSVYVTLPFRFFVFCPFSFPFLLLFSFIHRWQIISQRNTLAMNHRPFASHHTFFFSPCILHHRITIHFSITVTRRTKTIRVRPRYREDLLAIILSVHAFVRDSCMGMTAF